MSLTNFAENALLDHVFGGPAYVRPATLYIGLSSTTPAEDGTNVTEPAVGSYARVAVTNDNTEFSAAAGGQKSNDNAVTFPEASADWGDPLTHVLVYDAAVAGNLIAFGALAAPATVTTGNTFFFGAGDLLASLD